MAIAQIIYSMDSTHIIVWTKQEVIPTSAFPRSLAQAMVRIMHDCSSCILLALNSKPTISPVPDSPSEMAFPIADLNSSLVSAHIFTVVD